VEKQLGVEPLNPPPAIQTPMVRLKAPAAYFLIGRLFGNRKAVALRKVGNLAALNLSAGMQ